MLVKLHKVVGGDEVGVDGLVVDDGAHHHVHVVTNKAVFENGIVFEEIDDDHLLKLHFSKP